MILWQFFYGLIWIMWSVALMIIAWAVICLPIIVGYGIYKLWRWIHDRMAD